MYLIKYPEIPPIGAMCSHVDQRRPLYFDRIYFRDTFANISFFKSRLKSQQKLANTWNRANKTEALNTERLSLNCAITKKRGN